MRDARNVAHTRCEAIREAIVNCKSQENKLQCLTASIVTVGRDATAQNFSVHDKIGRGRRVGVPRAETNPASQPDATAA